MRMPILRTITLPKSADVVVLHCDTLKRVSRFRFCVGYVMSLNVHHTFDTA
jgi:hypothetical protein